MRLRHVIMSAPYRPLSGYGGAFGSLPDYGVVFPADSVMGVHLLGESDFGKLWKDGLQPGNPYVVNFKGQWKRAQALSKEAEADFKPGTPVRNLQKKLDAELMQALADVWQRYQWDVVCGIGPRGYLDNCRSRDQADWLLNALERTRDRLKDYDKLELAMSQVPTISPMRSDYDPESDPAVIAKREAEAEAKTEQREARELAVLQQRATIAKQFAPEKEEETPLWKKLLMYGVPGLALVWGVSRILKKRRTSVAGYGRASRKRRKARR